MSQEVPFMSDSDYRFVVDDNDFSNFINSSLAPLMDELPSLINVNPGWSGDDNTNTNAISCDAISLISHPGIYNFHLVLPEDGSVPNAKWTFSNKLKKFFIDMNKVLAVQFSWDHQRIRPGFDLFVRAIPVYKDVDSINEHVKRCPIHKQPNASINEGFEINDLEHVMRCERAGTVYEIQKDSGRLSCRAPLNAHQPGSNRSNTTTLLYKFVCKTSCVGGMNRRPISVLFTLEDITGFVHGKDLIDIKICSCPKRDKDREEENADGSKKRKIDPSIQVEDFRNRMNSTSMNYNNYMAGGTSMNQSFIDYGAPRANTDCVQWNLNNNICKLSEQINNVSGRITGSNLSAANRPFLAYVDNELLKMTVENRELVKTKIFEIIDFTRPKYDPALLENSFYHK